MNENDVGDDGSDLDEEVSRLTRNIDNFNFKNIESPPEEAKEEDEPEEAVSPNEDGVNGEHASNGHQHEENGHDSIEEEELREEKRDDIEKVLMENGENEDEHVPNKAGEYDDDVNEDQHQTKLEEDEIGNDKYIIIALFRPYAFVLGKV